MLPNLALNDEVEDVTGTPIGKISNLIMVSGVQMATVEGIDKAFRNYPLINLRKRGTAAKQDKTAPESAPSTLPQPKSFASTTRAEAPGIISTFDTQLFLLGEHRYVIVTHNASAVSAWGDALKELDPEARAIVLYNKEEAAFTALEHSSAFQTLVRGMVLDTINALFPKETKPARTTNKRRQG